MSSYHDDTDNREPLILNQDPEELSGVSFSLTGDGKQSKANQLKSVLEDAYQRIITPNVGCALIILSQIFNSSMVVSCKLLIHDPDFEVPIHPLQILFTRMSITYICCFIYMYVAKVPGFPFGPKELRKWLILRGVVGFFGVFGLYYSLQYLAVSDAVAITFLVPMVTAIAAWIVLHERYSGIEAIGTVSSLVGVLLIARPSFIFGDKSASEDRSIESSDPFERLLAVSVGLVGVAGASSVYIVLRKIGTQAHPLLSVSYFALYCVFITTVCLVFIPSLSFATPHTRYQWFLFCLIGISGFFMQFCLTAGVQREKAGRSAFMTYSQMIFAIFWDIVIWHHIPSPLSWLGFTIIISSAISVIYFKPKNQEVISNNTTIRSRHLRYDDLEGKPGQDFAMSDLTIDDYEGEDEEENAIFL